MAWYQSQWEFYSMEINKYSNSGLFIYFFLLSQSKCLKSQMFNIYQHTTESTAPSHGLYSIHGEGKEEFISAPVIQRTKNNNQNVH